MTRKRFKDEFAILLSKLNTITSLTNWVQAENPKLFTNLKAITISK